MKLGVPHEAVTDPGPGGFVRREPRARRRLGVLRGEIAVQLKEARGALRRGELRRVAEEGAVQDVEARREGLRVDPSLGQLEGEDQPILDRRRRLTLQI